MPAMEKRVFSVQQRLARWVTRGFLFLMLLILGYAAYQRIFYGPTEFNREVWLSGEKAKMSQDAPRLRMADGLIESGVLMGKTRAQIDAMLGPQTDTPYFRPRYDFVYWLGAERGYMSIDSEWLVLRIGATGGVAEARIVRD